MFDTEGCSDIDVKVPSTRDPDISVWAECVQRRSWKLSTDCGNQHRHSERKSNKWDIRELRAPSGKGSHIESKGRPWARTSQKNSVEIFQVMQSQVFRKRQPSGRGMQENVNVMDHHHRKITSGSSKTESPNLIKGPNPYQILGKLTSPTKKEDMKFAGKKDQRWQVVSCITRFITVFVLQNLFSSELYNVTQASILI